MPLQATSGAASYDAFGGGVPVVPNYIEDVFSTWLYTGNDSTQTITNGIDLSTKGGLVFIKNRSNAYGGFAWYDTARGPRQLIRSNSTTAQVTAGVGNELTSFNSDGFSLGPNDNADVNVSPDKYASWTFREQPKFFDVVTYTGTGSNATISHNLGSEPGCIIVKRTDTAGQNWYVYHRGATAGNKYLILNRTDAEDSGFFWTPTSTTFNVSSTLGLTAVGGTYICYLFAHNAGGFGLTGTDNVISCGSYAGNSSTNGPTVTLGYEPQWVMIKNVTTAGAGYDWYMADNMRGIPMSGDTPLLEANLSDAESGAGQEHALELNATGFKLTSPYGGLNNTGNTYIYIAIRRPMKVPTVGTSVFSPNAYAGTSSAQTQTTNFPVDLFIDKTRNAASDNFVIDRLRGSTPALATNSTGAEDSLLNIGLDSNTGVKFLASQLNGSGSDFILWAFKRAPSFFDAVCYTGTGSATTFSHNLAAVPELMIVKRRSAANAWAVYANNDNTDYLVLNTTAATADDNTYWNDTSPTSSVFSVGTNNAVNASASTYVAYLFATCAGVSKVGSYTGNGSTQTINCGFGAGGARFVLIKRTDSTGGWYVYDTARGMTLLTDPYLFLNTTAAEAATLGSVTTVSTGFALDSTILAAINVSAGTYIFLAIA